MLTTKEVAGVKVVRPNKPGKEYTKDGLPRHRRKIGKIYKTVFAPDGMRVVGFIVRRPDLLWMFKRPERFLALDAFDIQDGLVVPSRGMASWDDKAIERMGVDYDTCIIWEGIQVKTRSGAELGHVGDISFDEKTGEVTKAFALSPENEADYNPAIFMNGIEVTLADGSTIVCKTAGQAYREAVSEWTLEKAAEVCWLDVDAIQRALDIYTEAHTGGISLGVATDQGRQSV